ncbi:hypothetical protein C173_20371 [Paenibacillus sp. FSL R7-277]|uniref:carbamoyltransferase C-terminal domain-containing protein n=1 Tax=Paenibacillus sp. FSL R7-277 TaxID=1227352 RepID=UPI0003E2B8BD|nr:carbamoyltransferase C-terminal domain-containing protein [Paenibacillus sp. FSL R7-277]ETT65420.1 hypothetical protein C173_20371 [Paenibacillus sp. FSL R7-277]
MKDGYYLSAYIDINTQAHILDLEIRHDQNVSLWKKEGDHVQLIHYWELERLTGYKQHSTSFLDIDQARRVINSLLDTYQLSLNDMNEVWGSPGLDTVDDYHSVEDFPEYAYHSVAHLFSAIYSETRLLQNDNIIGLAVDHGPDHVNDPNVYRDNKYCYIGCIVKNGQIEFYPLYSPALLWAYCRLRYNLREGTLMALASASTSELLDVEEETFLFQTTGVLNNSYQVISDYIDGLEKNIDQATEQDIGIVFNGFDKAFDYQDNKISMVMKEIQKMSIRIMDLNVKNLLERSGIEGKDTYLSITGGFALNCPTNTYLMQKYNFKGFISTPCVSDTGMSMGIALYAFYKKIHTFHFSLGNSYYGNQHNGLLTVIESEPYQKHILSISEFNPEEAVRDLINGPFIWFYGRSEIGPRALGNRSIIADPRYNDAKTLLNQVKDRQWWRPVAPIILEEHLKEWFDGSEKSPYMLHTYHIREDKKNQVPAILHLDNSARIQTIKKDEKDLLYGLIEKFNEETGVPIVCNTSLNDKGEPIIDRIEEAINFALRKNFKIIYVNGMRVELHRHGEYEENRPLPRPLRTFHSVGRMKEIYTKLYNPFNVSKRALIFYYMLPDLMNRYDIMRKEDVQELENYADDCINKLRIAAFFDKIAGK